MSLSICINCGHTKSAPTAKCPNCGFVPESDTDKAKSLILSLNYEIEGVYRGQTKERLFEVGEQIKQHRYSFDEDEVNKVIGYAHKVLSVPVSRLLKDLFKWIFWPAVLLVVAVFIILRGQ